MLRHAVALTFDPLTLNTRGWLGVMYGGKLCTIFERDISIRGWVINDLQQHFVVLVVHKNSIFVLKRAWTRSATNRQGHTKFKNGADISLRFGTIAAQSW